MKLPAYPEYKATGAEWLGDVPKMCPQDTPAPARGQLAKDEEGFQSGPRRAPGPSRMPGLRGMDLPTHECSA